jgi:hypothetical protein
VAWGYRASSFVATASAAFPISTSLAAAASAGDRVVVGVLTRRNGATPTTPTVSDSINAGNYTEDAAITFSDGAWQIRTSIFSHANSGAGTPSITVTSASSQGGFMAAAYSGLLTSDPGVDKTKTNAPAAGTTPATTGASAATTAANEPVVAAYFDSGWDEVISSSNVGSGFTFRGLHQLDSGDYEGFYEDKDSGTSGTTQTATLTGTPNNTHGSVTWAMLEAVYQLAAAGGPQDTPELYGRPAGLRGQAQMHQLLAT